MMKSKGILLLIGWGVLTLLAPEVRAQSLELFKVQLARPTIDTLSQRQATVEVWEEEVAGNALRRQPTPNLRQRFQGWRICIFSDNTADARMGAHEAIKLFEERFPTIPLYDEYASPYFRVSVGNCTTPEEAIILLERVRGLFPKAFVKQEQLSLQDLLKEQELIEAYENRPEPESPNLENPL